MSKKEKNQPVNIYPLFDNLWSHHNSDKIEKVIYRLKELKLQGQYYEEVNMPDVDKTITGLMNDINILKKDKTLLLAAMKNIK